jgi:hypothetical protein
VIGPAVVNGKSDPAFDIQLVRRGISPEALKRRFTMSITRRQFLLGMASTSAGLIVPTYLTKATQFLEETGQPLLIPPKHIITELYAVDFGDGEFELYLGDPDEMPPQMTHREFAEYTGYSTLDEYFKAHYGEEEEYRYIDPDDYVDYEFVGEAWARSESPNARAFHLLGTLDLMPLSGYPGQGGELVFVDGACPGNDYLGVHAVGAHSLSLLQARLNQLDTGIRIILEGAAT